MAVIILTHKNTWYNSKALRHLTQKLWATLCLSALYFGVAFKLSNGLDHSQSTLSQLLKKRVYHLKCAGIVLKSKTKKELLQL